jgi:hypothetical protein
MMYVLFLPARVHLKRRVGFCRSLDSDHKRVTNVEDSAYLTVLVRFTSATNSHMEGLQLLKSPNSTAAPRAFCSKKIAARLSGQNILRPAVGEPI